MRNTHNKLLIFLLFLLFILTFFWESTSPDPCGDIFWHLEYGKQHVDNLTLTPDHSVYSWTATDNTEIYCTWLADVFFYILFSAGGWPLLYILRYLCLALALFLLFIFTKRLNKEITLYSLSVILVVQQTIMGASTLKPEMLSLVFFVCLGLIYFTGKRSHRNRPKAFFFLPLLFLIWVNCHGVFFFGLLLLFAINVGELINYRLNKQHTFSKQKIKSFMTLSTASFFATFINPYGYKIYSVYYNIIFSGNEDIAFGIKGYLSILTQVPNADRSHILEYAGIMTIIIIFYNVLLWKKNRETDWGIILGNLFLAALFFRYLRSAFYWPPIWAMTIFYLHDKTGEIIRINKKSILFLLNSTLVIAFIYIAGRSIIQTQYNPKLKMWVGLGINYQHPVQECEFIKKYKPGKKLYNSYNTGSYIIHSLYPEYKVFIDPRGFPYRKWRKRNMDFHYGKIPLEQFYKDYDFDIAIVDYWAELQQFSRSPEWEPAFYGTAGTVYIKKNSGFHFDVTSFDNKRFDNVKNLEQCLRIFNAAISLNDLDAALYICKEMKENFNSRYKNFDRIYTHCNSTVKGILAYNNHDHHKALELLTQVGFNHYETVDKALLYLMNKKTDTLIRNHMYYEAYEIQKLILDEYNNINSLLNTGLLGAVITLKTNLKKPAWSTMNGSDWKAMLKGFIKRAPDHPYTNITKEILTGQKFTNIEIPIQYKGKKEKTIITINSLSTKDEK